MDRLCVLLLLAASVHQGATEKPGTCPPRSPDMVGVCADLCMNDSDCPDCEKCCSNGCGHQCTAPHWSGPRPGPRPDPLPVDPLPVGPVDQTPAQI